ncbi:MAG: site-specific integrase, partial [Acidimicrobiia bacterium]|nr:site-specific integrase [Acidimicrobiia bacterium]
AFLIAQGAHPKAVQEHMGHSSITVTYDRYGHLFPSLAEQLAEGLDTLYADAAGGARGEGEMRVLGRSR